MGMQPTNQNPPSPVKGLGYVSGSSGVDKGLNGYVGEKPAVKEEPQNPQSRRQMTNFASPDPSLSNQAFTQSQFTSNISAGALQAQSARNCAGGGCNMPNAAGGNNNAEASSQSIDDTRRANLRRYKESSGGGRGGSSGYSPHPSFSMQQQQQQRPSNQTLNQRGDQHQQNQGISQISSLGQQQQEQQQTPEQTPTTQESSVNNSDVNNTETFVAYTLSDPGSMYKSFSGTASWFRVVQVIVPQGKRVKRVYVSSMILPQTESGERVDPSPVYSIRLVDPNNVKEGRLVPLWADYSCTNTENFQVFTMDLSNTSAVPNGGLLEIQAQNSDGLPVLFASAMVEF